MAITRQDLIRFGLIQDPKAYLESETKKWSDFYNQSIAERQKAIQESRSDSQYEYRSSRLEDTLRQREQRFDIIDKRYNALLERQSSALENPSLVTRARQLIEEEVGRERAQLQEETRRTTEGIQRGEAEREAARARSRRAGGGRGMLAGYGVSLPQGIGGRATLGRASTLGSPMGGAAASTLGRSLLG